MQQAAAWPPLLDGWLQRCLRLGRHASQTRWLAAATCSLSREAPRRELQRHTALLPLLLRLLAALHALHQVPLNNLLNHLCGRRIAAALGRSTGQHVLALVPPAGNAT